MTTPAQLHFDMVVTGFGRGGKTLAGAYAPEPVRALIEQSRRPRRHLHQHRLRTRKALVHRADGIPPAARRSSRRQTPPTNPPYFP